MHDEILQKLWWEKSERALRDAKSNLALGALETAQNRVYYAIFYAVGALARQQKFVTAKHSGLLAWFNRNYIHTKIVDYELAKIYRHAFENRQKCDYEFTYQPTPEKLERDILKAEIFIAEIKKLIS